MATSAAVEHRERRPAGHLQRAVGFWGLTFVSLGSIIGSGWLLGALGAALAMLGPGAWSVDARLFGRKRIQIP